MFDLIQEAKDLDAGLIYLCDLITSGRSQGEEDDRITSAEWRELADFILEDMLSEESRLEYDIGAKYSYSGAGDFFLRREMWVTPYVGFFFR